MSEEQAKQREPGNEVPRQGEEDWFLQSLVNMANSSSMETGITLTVGGFQVTGMMISGRRYFEEFGKLFASGLFKEEGPDKEELAQSFAKHGDMYAKPEDEQSPPSYIHLRNAKFFGPGGEALAVTNGNGVLWRGRIAEVGGFLLGAYSR